MEEVLDSLRDYIKNHLKDYLDEMATSDTPLPMVKDKAILYGPVDLSRYENSVVCAILPEGESEEEGDISSTEVITTLTVAFIVQGTKQDVLIRQMCRYASAFRKMLLNDYTLGGEVDDISIKDRKFYFDAGTVEEQLCVAEITIEITTTEEYEE